MLGAMPRLPALALGLWGLLLTPSCRDPAPPAPQPAASEPAPSERDAAPPKPDARPEPAPADDALALRDALQRGIPALTYHTRPARDAAGQPQIPYQDLRIGLYDPVARRFVPVTPAVPSALGGVIDRQAGRALVLAGDLVMGEIWLVQARRVDVSIFELAVPVRVVLEADDVDARHEATDRIRVAVEAGLAGDAAARVTLAQLGYEPQGTASVLVRADGVTLAREPVGEAGAPHLYVDASGSFVEQPPPEGLAIDREGLHVPGRRTPLPLAPGHEQGHRQVSRTPDGRVAMVFTVEAGCRELAFARHVLDRVDLERGTVTRLSSAPTQAGAALAPDGSIYLDDGSRVLRFPPGRTEPVDDVLPGVRFVTPDFDRDCSI